MNDDFNTPEAVAALFELANEVNKLRSQDDARLLKSLAATLGLLQRDALEFLQSRREVAVALTGVEARANAGNVIASASSGPSDTRIKELIERRSAARKEKNFAESDRIRGELLAAGIVLEDGPGGTTWRRS
jgi:cysteinyl-tRNA synthetase